MRRRPGTSEFVPLAMVSDYAHQLCFDARIGRRIKHWNTLGRACTHQLPKKPSQR